VLNQLVLTTLHGDRTQQAYCQSKFRIQQSRAARHSSSVLTVKNQVVKASEGALQLVQVLGLELVLVLVQLLAEGPQSAMHETSVPPAGL